MILSINTGSTSLKYALFTKKLHIVERGGFSGRRLTKEYFKNVAKRVLLHHSSIGLSIVHRVVHGGPHFRKPAELSPRLLGAIKKYSFLAPLHNPYNLMGIRYAKEFFRGAREYAVFDTGFFKNLPDVAKWYPISPAFANEHHIFRYGFHGISHEFAMEETKRALKKRAPNLITIHLGGGSSITAIQKGKPIDTSMGYSPLEGMMMWARAGDIDPLIATIVGKKFLHEHAGLQAISGREDYLDLLEHYGAGDPRAITAFDMFVYRAQKYIGAYFAALRGKIDAIVFTGKIGAGKPITRTAMLRGMAFLKRIPVIVVAPDEELMMARAIVSLNQ